MRDISREGILLAGAGRALLLQLAHPAVGEGVARHSDFASDPLKRLHGTLTFIYAVATGTETDAAAARRAVNHAHAPVRGATYNAMDPGLQLWVAATLYDSAIVVYERTFGSLPDDDAERVYREYAVLGTALQMPVTLWPATRADFREYLESVPLAVNREVRSIAKTLLSGQGLPWYWRPLVPVARRLTAELLPPDVRTLYGMRDAKALDRVIRIYRLMPRWIRHAPQRYYLRRLRLR